MRAAQVLWLAVGAVALVIGAASYALLRLSAEPHVIDAEGRLRLYIRSHDAAPEAIAHDLRLLIKRGSA